MTVLGPALAAILLTLAGPAHADAWSPVSTIHLTEVTQLTLTDPDTVQAHLTIEVLGYGVKGDAQAVINVLLPEDAELTTARWKPAQGSELEVKPAAVATVTWPGDVDQIVHVARSLHSGSTPYMIALEALFPDRVIRWRQLTFIVPVEGKGGRDERLGVLEVIATVRPRPGHQGTYLAWPIPAGVNPAYRLRVRGMVVGFAAVYDPETGRWRWVIPGQWNYLEPTTRSTAIIDVAGLPFGITVSSNGVGVLPGPTEEAARFLSLTQYLPVLVVMSVLPIKPALQRGETTVTTGRATGTARGVRPAPTPVIPPIAPIRRRR